VIVLASVIEIDVDDFAAETISFMTVWAIFGTASKLGAQCANVRVVCELY
jgi:hypothetical protein